MDDESLGGVLDVIDTESSALHDKAPQAKPEPKEEPKESKSPEVTKEVKEVAKTEAEPADEDEEEVKDTQDFSRNVEDESSEDVEDSSAEPLENETTDDTAETPADEDEFKLELSPEPQFQGKVPEYDEEGYITNMTPQEYQKFIIDSAAHQIRMEQWANGNETKALEAAEKILPEIKTNKAVAKMVESARVASILNGDQINSYEAAKIVKEALGLSTKTVSEKVAQAKAEGIKSAKVSITTQKNAAVETKGSSKKKSDSSKDAQLVKRLKTGDDEAFAELFAQWDKDGKL